MTRVLQTAPTEYPVSIEELRDHLRIVGAEEDGYLDTLIRAATAAAEAETWSRFVTQTWDLKRSSFCEDILLPYPPAASITSITYVDTAGTTQTLGTSVYELGSLHGVGHVRLKYGQTWPAVRGWYDDVVIRYVCGYGAASAVPTPIKQAILFLAAHLFENRVPVNIGNLTTELPMTVKFLLSPYDWRTAG